jgi:hypothetical protein
MIYAAWSHDVLPGGAPSSARGGVEWALIEMPQEMLLADRQNRRPLAQPVHPAGQQTAALAQQAAAGSAPLTPDGGGACPGHWRWAGGRHDRHGPRPPRLARHSRRAAPQGPIDGRPAYLPHGPVQASRPGCREPRLLGLPCCPAARSSLSCQGQARLLAAGAVACLLMGGGLHCTTADGRRAALHHC